MDILKIEFSEPRRAVYLSIENIIRLLEMTEEEEEKVNDAETGQTITFKWIQPADNQ